MARIITAAILIWLTPAAAEAEVWQECFGGVPGAKQVAGCSTVIDQPQRPVKEKAAALNQRGVAFYRGGELARAVADFDRALSLDGKVPNVYLNRAIVLRAQGFNERALADLDR